jgi:rhomboid protease GluP
LPAILCPSCRKLISSDEPRCLFCGQVRPGLWGLTTLFRRFGLRVDFPHMITLLCVGLFIASLLLDITAVFDFNGGLMSLLSPSMKSSWLLGMTGYHWAFVEGRWWTLITAIYLHGGLLHIFFNMMWVRQLGPLVEELYGPFRLFVIFTVAGVVGFLFSTLIGAHYVGDYPRSSLGASGSIFGLLAAAIVYGRKAGSTLFTRQFLQWAGLLFVFGFIMSGVDNWAHAGGFVGGYAASYLFSRSQGSREGLGTYIAAGACVVLTIAAFLLQFLTMALE